MFRTAAPLLLLLLGLTGPAGAAPVQIVIGSAAATAGGVVTIGVTIDPVDQTLLGGGNDIEFAPPISIQTRPDGTLDCTANPALAPLLEPSFTCISPSASPCTRLRALVFRPYAAPPLPSALLYTCAFAIAPTAAAGTSLPLSMRVPRAVDRLARTVDTHGLSGSIQIVAPTPTTTPSETPAPSATPVPSATAVPSPTRTASPSLTPTASLTRTLTRTRTPTLTPRTPVPTLTPTRTVTPTATAVIALRVIGGVAPPGATLLLTIGLSDRSGRASGITADLVLPDAVFDAHAVAIACALDARLTAHRLSANVVGDPPVSLDLRRLRLVVSEQSVPPVVLGSGPLLTCAAALRPSAPPGDYPLVLDRLFAGDVDGTLLLGVGAVRGTLLVDPSAPSATATATRTVRPAATATRTLTVPPSPTMRPSPIPTATRTATDAPPPSPTPTVMPSSNPTEAPTAAPCAGDCDGDGMVAIDELVRAVTIASGAAPAASCNGLDANADGAVTISEVVAAVGGSLSGCAAAAR